jgi:uncharacterized protein YjbI with pentapeptide repeats
LRSANLSFTDLSGQDLSGKDLRGINFHSANLENVDMSNITISKVLQYYQKPECSDPRDTFENTLAGKRCLIEVLQNESIRTDFSNANLNGVTFSVGANDPKEYFTFVDFSGADLTGIEFSGLNLQAANFKPENSIPVKSAPEKSTKVKYSLGSFAPTLNVTPFRFALLKSVLIDSFWSTSIKHLFPARVFSKVSLGSEHSGF